MSKAQTPSVGDSIHYYPADGGEPNAAIVAGVNEDGTVNLAVMDRLGNTGAVQNVAIAGDKVPSGPHCKHPGEAKPAEHAKKH